MSSNRSGVIQQTDFMDNVGGLNLSDSVFKVKETQAVGGQNYSYALTGGVITRMGPVKVNTVADTELKSIGLGLFGPSSGATKSVLRAAGSRLQYLDTGTPAFTNLTEDTVAAGSAPFSGSSTQPVNFTQFNSGVSDILWGTGGGATLPVGAYSTSKYTINGVNPPTGSFSATPSASGLGSWTAAGYYTYALVLRKGSTLALSNAALDQTEIHVTNTTDSVALSWTLTSLDTTLIDEIWIYRSTVSVTSVDDSGFTAGSLIARLASSATSFTDLGDIGNPDVLSSQLVPRAGNVILDNSVLPAGTYIPGTLFKRRYVVAKGSTIYLSDVNKSESWPTTNYITVPSAGKITAFAVMSFTSPQAQTLDEIIVVWKERELWVITGDSWDGTIGSAWTLKFIDQVGCVNQTLAVVANGFLAWIDFRGVYLWDGTSKPIYCSRPLEPLFGYGGDLDKTKFAQGASVFFRRENHIYWFLSSKTYGEQKYALKLDLRLTLPSIEQTLTGRMVDGVFSPDTYAQPVYACLSYIPSGGSQERVLTGDASGFGYFFGTGFSDSGTGINFAYKTTQLSMGNPNVEKQYHTVIAWVQDIGNWNLTLDYWTNYKTASNYATTQQVPISTTDQSAALWDIATWDLSYWDDYSPDVVPIIFNLMPGSNNTTQGTSIQLQFRNSQANQPITIQGFSVLWSALGGISSG